MNPPRILILGGTGQARRLATALMETGRFDVETSLAGVTESPLEPIGRVRRGGFGGPDALASYLREGAVSLLIDATHPFAARISGNAILAARLAARPLLKLERPPWRPMAGDNWSIVADEKEAVETAARLGRRIFLTLGARSLGAFAELREHVLVARVATTPDRVPNHPDLTVIVERGPFDLPGEAALLSHHAIDVVVAKNSGGGETAAKLEAARAIGLPVVMLDRPLSEPTPGIAVVSTVDEAVTWVLRRL